MSHNPFRRRPKGQDHGDEDSEFAATVQSLPADSLPETAPAALPGGPGAAQFGTDTDIGADSLPAPADLAALRQRPTISHIGRYALKGLLGAGGLGQVHEAWDPMLSRTVAIKTLQFDVDRASRIAFDELFLNEARTAAGLSHAHIVTVHDAGLSAHGVYIAMERLQGQDLRQRLAAGWQPTPAQAAHLASRVADALAYAHARGVVHCDIKPANIFLCRRDKPKVLDFGIARVAHGTVLPLLDGAVAGSPHYLAPEQLRGGAVDARTDIHALGVVLYELLTLRRAYAGDSVEQITNAVLSNHPAPAHEVRQGVPRTLSAIAARAMASAPDDRYASAAELAADLRRWLDRHSGADTPAAAPAPAPARTRRAGRALRAAAGGLGVLLAAVLVLALLQRARAPRAAPAGAPQVATPVPVPVPVPLPMPVAPAPAPAVAAAVPALPAGPGVAPARPRPGAAAAQRAPRAAASAAAAPPPATGIVQLAISPWGEVDVDGRPAGTTPPLARLSLSEGSHTVTVRNEDFPPHVAIVQVSADQPVTVRHRFDP